ncbi:MAG: hypothetical protein ABH862_01845 [Candidatus Omnitrophota bacterium]
MKKIFFTFILGIFLIIWFVALGKTSEKSVKSLPTLTSKRTYEPVVREKVTEDAEEKAADVKEEKNKKSLDAAEDAYEPGVDLAISKITVGQETVAARITNLMEGKPIENIKVSFYVWEEKLKGSYWRNFSNETVKSLPSGINHYVEVTVPLSQAEREKGVEVKVNPDETIPELSYKNNTKSGGVKIQSLYGGMFADDLKL